MSRSQRNNRKERKKLKATTSNTPSGYKGLKVVVDKNHQLSPGVRKLFGDNQRAINRVENPMQNLVDDTNKILQNYQYMPIDNDTLSSLRSALYKMIEAWRNERLIKPDFDDKSYVNMVLDKIKAQVPPEMRVGLISA